MAKNRSLVSMQLIKACKTHMVATELLLGAQALLYLSVTSLEHAQRLHLKAKQIVIAGSLPLKLSPSNSHFLLDAS